MELIERLRTYRLEHKITQQTLAKKLGVAFSTINRWFNGKATPNEVQSYHINKLLSERTKNDKRKKSITKNR